MRVPVVTRTSLQQPICELISQHRYPLKRFFFFNGDSPDASPVTTSARRVLLVEVVSVSSHRASSTLPVNDCVATNLRQGAFC